MMKFTQTSLLTIALPLLLLSCGKYMPTEMQKPINLNFNSEGTVNIAITTNFVTSSNKTLRALTFDSAQKRLLVLISSQRCSSCQQEHSEIQQALDNNTLDDSKFNIISLMIATDFSYHYDFLSVEELMDNSGMDWPIGEDLDLTLFNKFCQGKTTPCSVVLEPNEGIIYAHNGVPDLAELSAVLNR